MIKEGPVKKIGVALKNFFDYIIYTVKRLGVARHQKKEDDIMNCVTKLQSINIPPHIMEKLKLKKNWQKDVSVNFVEEVVKTAEKHKKTLNELSKS